MPPYKSTTYGISKSGFYFIKNEIERGYNIVMMLKALAKTDVPLYEYKNSENSFIVDNLENVSWETLFKKRSYFTEKKYYLQIEAMTKFDSLENFAFGGEIDPDVEYKTYAYKQENIQKKYKGLLEARLKTL